MIVIGAIKVKRFRQDGLRPAALCYVGPLAIDGDGGPHTASLHGDGRDWLANERRDPKDPTSPYVGVVVDAAGNPIEQGADSPAPHFLVSTTALIDTDYPERDQRRYVNSETRRYLALPPELEQAGAPLGTLGMVLNTRNGIWADAFVADTGPHRKLGEGSEALADALRVPSSPKNGGASSGIAVVLFPGSVGTPRWPRDAGEIITTSCRLFEAWGGTARLVREVA